jgi:ABC-type multidrug transport system fused ATPase/permease subunit
MSAPSLPIAALDVEAKKYEPLEKRARLSCCERFYFWHHVAIIGRVWDYKSDYLSNVEKGIISPMRTLSINDLCSNDQDLSADHCTKIVELAWEEEQQAAKSRKEARFKREGKSALVANSDVGNSNANANPNEAVELDRNGVVVFAEESPSILNAVVFGRDKHTDALEGSDDMAPASDSISFCCCGASGMKLLAIIYLLRILFSLGQPLFFLLIMGDFFGDSNSPLFRGYIYVAGIVVSSILTSFFEKNVLYQANRLKIKAMNGLRGLLYKKALKLRESKLRKLVAKDKDAPGNATANSANTAANAKVDGGGLSQWVSVISADAPSVAEYINVFMPLWMGIFEICLAIAFMIYILDYAALAGVVIVFTLGYVTQTLSRWTGAAGFAIGKEQGKRTQLLGQLLSIIRAVKFYAWENEFLKKLYAQREAEQVHLSTFHLYKTVNWVIAVAGPLAIGIAVMLIRNAYAPLTLAVTFPALVLLGILRNIIWNFPVLVNAYLDAELAAGRINNFLALPEVPRKQANANQDDKEKENFKEVCSQVSGVGGGVAKINEEDERENVDTTLPLGTIIMEHGNFGWTVQETDKSKPVPAPADASATSSVPADKPTHAFSLFDISFRCSPGSLTAIVGNVGSGKQSIFIVSTIELFTVFSPSSSSS